MLSLERWVWGILESRVKAEVREAEDRLRSSHAGAVRARVAELIARARADAAALSPSFRPVIQAFIAKLEKDLGEVL